jgi:signal transduction histidine kinase
MPLAMLKNTTTAVSEHGAMALVRAVERLATAADISEIIEIVRTTARSISGADGITFVLRDGDLCHYVEEDAIGPLWKGKRFPLTACISGWCMLNDRPAVIPDIYVDPRIPHDAYRPTFVKSLVMVPVKVDEPIAAIGSYWAAPRDFSDEELSLIEALGRSASVAIAAVQLRENLIESGQRLSMALDAGGLGAWELNLASGELIATEACRKIFGREPGAPFSRQDLIDTIHPDDQPQASLVFATGPQPSQDEEYRITLPAGERRIEMRGRVMLDANGQPVRVSGVVRDVTEFFEAKQRLDTLRSELMRSERLNDLGAMASALAHELNQPLAAASNYMHAAERLLSKDVNQALNAISKAEAQFVRTKEIIQRIRGFVGQGQSTRSAEDLRTVFGEVLELVHSSALYDNIAVRVDIESDLPKVEIDKVQIQQVLLNLMRNAFEAMAQSQRRQVTVSAKPGENMVEVRVADTGPGLPDEIAGHLFQPFHSSKPGGMGVGLSLCRKIVEGHGGRIWHEPGAQGATFCFTIPAAALH